MVGDKGKEATVKIITPLGFLILFIYFVIVQVAARWDWFLDVINGKDNLIYYLGGLSVAMFILVFRFGVKTYKGDY